MAGGESSLEDSEEQWELGDAGSFRGKGFMIKEINKHLCIGFHLYFFS